MSITKAELITENARLRKRVALLERARGRQTAGSEQSQRLRTELAEALEQQTATSEILRVISGSPTDIQPVLDSVAESAARLCESFDSAVYRLEGDRLRLVAHHGPIPLGPIGEFTLPLVRGTGGGRSVLDGRTVHVADMQTETEEFPESSENARRRGFRTILAMPLMREGRAIGTITVRRTTAQLFTERQVALLQTFADQAVIAIENARLFTELEARNRELRVSLEQQTATSEVLKVIGRSTFDLQPVFETLAENAIRLCAAERALIYRFDGQVLRVVATHNASAELITFLERNPLALTRASAAGRAFLERRTIHVHDVLADPEYTYGATQVDAVRTVLGIPMLRSDELLGAIVIYRHEIRPFTADQITLMETFADQAVIAIENVRLFKELEARNRELTEALEHQTATAEILRVISSSLTDVQPVLDAVAESAARLCDAPDVSIFSQEADHLRVAARHGSIPSDTALPLSRESGVGWAVLAGRTVHVADMQAEVDRFPVSVQNARRLGFRTALNVPLIREGVAIGAISLRRTEAHLFAERQVALLETFADQAVIAIENVRLFTELRDKNQALTQAHAQVTETLGQQMATSEILRAISSSPTDVQPVFDTIVESAGRLCRAESAAVYRFEDEMAYFVASYHFSPATIEAYHRLFPCPLHDTDHLQRVVDGSVFNIPDIEKDPHTSSRVGDLYRSRGVRSTVYVPMVREGRAIGAIGVFHHDLGAFSEERVELLKTFADQAVIAIENVRLFNETKEALEQQTATSEILRVISSSPTDVQPVFDVIVERAVRLCGARFGRVYRYDGDVIHMVAGYGLGAAGLREVHRIFPRPASDDTIVGRVILTRQPALIRDIEREERVPALSRRMIEALETRSQVTIPMLRTREPIGAMTLGWAEPDAFDEQQIALLKTFADQAVIAIENVRLFKELEARNRDLTEALEQQTATSEVLKVISRSTFDLQPVLNTLIENATKLCDAAQGNLYRFDGEALRVGAFYGVSPEYKEFWQGVELRPGRGSVGGRVALERRTVQVLDVLADPEFQQVEAQRIAGSRTYLGVPMLREGMLIGAIVMWRREVRAFTNKQVDLVTSFADQAVIAIENVRLFKELEARNRDLTEALDRQTATADILRVISRSQTDVQPVFDTIADNAVSLFRPWSVAVYRFDGECVHVAAVRGGLPGSEEYLRGQGPRRPTRNFMAGRCIIECSVVHIPDFETARDVPAAAREIALLRGFKATLTVPMLKEGQPIGVISVSRSEAGAFSQAEIDLLLTFADQAVIAIENVRLFKELDARTQDLTRSVGELRALGEVGQAISSTLDLRTVLSTIVARATQLSGTDAGVIYEYDEQGEVFVPRATEHLETEIVETMLATPVRKGEGATGRLAEIQEPGQVPDILAAPAESRVRGALVRAGYRALLAVPLVRDDHLLGGLTVIRKATGAFAPEVIELLQTFATQSALAIQNARLFLEIEDKSRQLEVASRHKSEFLANMSHELRTPLNAIIGFSEVLMQRMFGELNTKQEEYLRDIYDSGRHLLSLINDILDLSKIEAGRMELELTDFDLPTAIDSALTLVRERATRRGITLQKTIDARVGQVQADERKVRQVVLNLLSNAIKFTPEGGRIEVQAVPGDGAVEVSVRDTGVGIAPEDQEAVFEEFRQVGTSAAKQEGTGLGLALCRKFVELHGGRIWVQSEVGRGSTFTFTLRVRP